MRWLLRFAIALAVVTGPTLVPMAAHAVPTPALAWSPLGTFTFATLDAALGQSASQTFTLTNTDGKSSGVLSVALSGSAAFTKAMDACTGKRLAPRKTCNVTVKYAPTANGTDNGTLAATSTGGASANVSLTGASAWQSGDLTTYTQFDYESGNNGASVLLNDAASVYPNVFEIGSSTGYTIQFTTVETLQAFFVQAGNPGVLSGDLIDPSVSPAGAFAADVAALKLNIDFGDAGDLAANSGLKFGDLTICGLTSDTDVNGMTVRDFLSIANDSLGATPTTTDSVIDIDTLTGNLDFSFDAGTPSTFAQAHLVNGSCP